MTVWTNNYVGLPYLDRGRTREGVDCWGLPRLVYADQLGIVLPAYTEAYTTTEEITELDSHIRAVTANGTWLLQQGGALPYDLVVFRRGTYETHVGIVVTAGLMLHVAADDCAKLEHYTTGRWAHRLAGIYRHFELASKVAS